MKESVWCLSHHVNFEVLLYEVFFVFNSSDDELTKMALAADRMKKSK